VIYIPLAEIKGEIPDDWFATATQALADVTVITDPQKRAQAINDRDDVWKALRERLARLRKDKCWYCESNDSRSGRPIDHKLGAYGFYAINLHDEQIAAELNAAAELTP
jgi:hypothetical protein